MLILKAGGLDRPRLPQVLGRVSTARLCCPQPERHAGGRIDPWRGPDYDFSGTVEDVFTDEVQTSIEDSRGGRVGQRLRIYLGQTQIHRPLDASPNVDFEVSEQTLLRETFDSAAEAFRLHARPRRYFTASGVFGYINDRLRDDSSLVLYTTYAQHLFGVRPDG